MENTSRTSSSNSAKEFFDLHTRGIGYLNRPRWVNPGKTRNGRRADPFLCCSVNALHGNLDEPSYSMFDCRVSGQDAQDIVQALVADVEAKRKVIIGFTIGDTYAHAYERKVFEHGKDTGKTEPSALIKGRLLQIGFAKVDGVMVYQRNKEGVVTTTLDLSRQEDLENVERTGTHG